ncbi:hypothetical protein LSTR_LSTR005630 [Laodelphax striatellus]|uniref:DRBM domain-containing protein n=1 Tax=Laodelphax striatellus TaxID=195883 RepID=A0A482WUZ8_LAOST|nr:hypothetical protein LSTR_LSTR005630 [Laodelphax striatellus]
MQSLESVISDADKQMQSRSSREESPTTSTAATSSDPVQEPFTKKQKLSREQMCREKANDLFSLVPNATSGGEHDGIIKTENIESECSNSGLDTNSSEQNDKGKYSENVNNYNEADTELDVENNPSLKELYVLDESNGFDDGEADAMSHSSDNNSCDDIPDDEIEALLEEGISDKIKQNKPDKTLLFKNETLREKLIKLATRVGMPLPSSGEESNTNANQPSNLDSNKSKDYSLHVIKSENGSNVDNDVGLPSNLLEKDGLGNQNSENLNAESCKMKEETSNPKSDRSKTNIFDDEEECKVFKIIDDDKNELEYEVRPKFVLEELEQNHFDLLPEGWVKLTHRSGMPLYLHRKSRVCTMSRPYYLGPGSNRNHSIPLEAIPCMQYRRALEKEEQMAAEASNSVGPSPLLRCARIETVEENRANQSLKHKEVRDYCSKLFRFKSINSVRYKSWGTRKLIASHKEAERLQRPTLPDGTKLLRFQIRNADGTPTNRPQREWIMNPAGKSYVCILHEYVQHALKSQPSYEFKELQNPTTPYSAEISIDGISYGKAFGTSKKQAKLLAAKAALEILIPDMKSKIDPDGKTTKAQGTDAHLSRFDLIRIEDPRVIEFSNKTTEPSPYKMLLTSLQRNHSLPTVNSNYVVSKKEKKRNEFTITVGGHSATVVCKNKHDGKQLAAQAILQALHPHVTTGGSLLRLYGNRSVKNIKEKKQQEKVITLLQSKASLNKPNVAILDKLRAEMQKLHES